MAAIVFVPQLGRCSYHVGLFVFTTVPKDWGVDCVCVCVFWGVGVYITGLNLNAVHDAVCRFRLGCSALLRAKDPSDTASILIESNSVLGPTRIKDT